MQRALLVALQPRIPALTLFSRLIPITPAYRCCAAQKSVGNKEKKRNAVMYRRRYIMLRTGEWRVGMVISVHDTMNPEANRRTFLRLPYTTITTSSLAIPTRKLLMSGQRKQEPWSSFFWGTSRRLTVHSPNPPIVRYTAPFQHLACVSVRRFGCVVDGSIHQVASLGYCVTVSAPHPNMVFAMTGTR